jgi:hypothetical protein
MHREHYGLEEFCLHVDCETNQLQAGLGQRQLFDTPIVDYRRIETDASD